MRTTKTIDAVISDADALVHVWSENLKFSMGDVTLEGLKAEVDKLRNLKRSLDEERIKLSKMVDDSHDQMKIVDGYNTRGRSGMRAAFGPDSAQYKQVGGTRQSERKPVTSRKKPKGNTPDRNSANP